MARTDARGGPRTRARIAETASGLFAEHGFDGVTVADVARAAGVSSVTVFNHFPRKEDLFFDRTDEAVDLLRAAVRDRPAGLDVVDGLRAAVLRMLDERHPLTGADPRAADFFATVAASPALLGRARGIGAELQQVLAAELVADPAPTEDPALVAALFVAGHGTVLTEVGKALASGEEPDAQLDGIRERFERLFAALRAAAG
ncbi:TetR/AcrR family transcriptional regulator [Klenkia brasiliensis]|uniref:Transcriptional regulator, TetR family n=1 Tax=Klenkia brasiliensis TaxID=333142 RepID=A0A1G8AA42_9ACTN|nr:TetR/AcrR family transcriptional regulator [Klenkia brasiliensis]SDH17834.1 transcriptional regulator, TetR family [Klenkia brasiliensis]